MAYVTISGASGTNIVNTIQYTSAATAALAQAAAANISSLITSSQATQASLNSGTAPTGTFIASIGSTVDTNVGPVTANNISTAVGFTINNLANTIASNSRFSFGNESVISGIGNLNFSDNAASTQIFAGGGNNTITFSSFSSNGSFTGDGANQIGVNTTSGVTSVFGTAASTDTIYGGSASSNIAYKSTAGSSAFILERNANLTVFGGAGGSTTVFGGANSGLTSPSGAGTLTVVNGQGFFIGGSGGPNIMSTSSIGGTTLVGGGNGDVLTSNGQGDIISGGSGLSTINASNSVGGDSLAGVQNGASVIYGSKSIGDAIFLTNSSITGALNGTSYTGADIFLHTGASTALYGLNSTVANIIYAGAPSAGMGAEKATINDFISGTDKLVLQTSVTGAGVTIAGGAGGSTVVTTTNGSTFTFLNAPIALTDIVKS